MLLSSMKGNAAKQKHIKTEAKNNTKEFDCQKNTFPLLSLTLQHKYSESERGREMERKESDVASEHWVSTTKKIPGLTGKSDGVKATEGAWETAESEGERGGRWREERGRGG